jgi:hypothetical protein
MRLIVARCEVCKQQYECEDDDWVTERAPDTPDRKLRVCFWCIASLNSEDGQIEWHHIEGRA